MNIFSLELSSDMLERLRVNIQDRLYGQTRKSLDAIQELVEEAICTAENNVKPKGTYHLLPVLNTDKDAVQTSAGKIQSPMFSHLVNQCKGERYIIFMVVTIGEALEEMGRSQKGILYQWVFDLVGSELVELVADRLEDQLEKADRAGIQYSTRFSPGYCDWALEGQRIIFNALDVEKIGVTLSSHMVMVPEKSVSAIKVTANEVPFSKPCFFCSKKDCHWRRL